MSDLRILFAGTSDIAVQTLEALAQNFNVVGILCASDKPGARGKSLISCPVKLKALELGLTVIECDHVNRAEREKVQALGANMLISFSFGRIFGPKFLAIFEKTMNIHPSKLPISRGPAPIQDAILSGQKTWSISYQEIGLEMDSGRIYACYDFDLDGTENTVSLTNKVSELAKTSVVEVLNNIDSIVPTPQQGEPSFSSLVEKADGQLDFNQTALEVHSRIRAMYDWPKAYTTVDAQPLMITKVFGGFKELEEASLSTVSPGTVIEYKKGRGFAVSCKDKVLWLNGFQFPFKKEITAADLYNSRKDIIGKRLGE